MLTAGYIFIKRQQEVSFHIRKDASYIISLFFRSQEVNGLQEVKERNFSYRHPYS